MAAVNAPRSLAALLDVLASRAQLRGVEVPPGLDPATVIVASIAYDSRRVLPGGLFVAIPGARADGHAFVPAAVAGGAAAVIVERPVAAAGPRDVPVIIVAGARPALATAAAWFYGHPGNRLCIVGITGTDGKTTTAYFVRSMLEAAGMPTGLIGTVETLAGGRQLRGPDHVTTPEAPELQASLAAMVAAGDRAAVVESTSHGLALDRVGEVPYDVAAITNLTHEHLELHRTHEAYRAAKRRLFEALAPGPANPEKGWGKTGVVNRADRWCGEFERATRDAGARLLSYDGRGIEQTESPPVDARPAAGVRPSLFPDWGGADRLVPDVRLSSLRPDGDGWHAEVVTARWAGPVHIRLGGRFNVENALAAVTVGEALHVDPSAIRGGIAAVGGVRGRMERVPTGLPFEVIVDFAHTPQALEIVLDELGRAASVSGGAVIAVFGSAGERDVVKRRVMGRVAGERCRLVVITDEDPRGEDRVAILEEIAEGAAEVGRRRGEDLLVVPDRAEAIAAAFERARPGDVVLLAGKGHEPTIEMLDGPHPWDERAAAETALERIRARLA
jgi:UDP-N-acetylmuramoyl-L-alanyl-D-glutamate--2,6-diaminopimelate ligase